MRCRSENRPALATGDVVIIKGEERNKNLWRLGIVTELFKGMDRIFHAAKIRCEKSELKELQQPSQNLKFEIRMKTSKAYL